MSTPMELVVTELDAETAQLLPERSALGLFNFAKIDNYVDSKAFSILDFWSDTKAVSYNDVHVYQH